MMIAEPPPISIDNIQLNLKQKINIKGTSMRGCCLLTDGRMVLPSYSNDAVRFINKDGVELFEISKGKTGLV
jgi:hypothetical protein